MRTPRRQHLLLGLHGTLGRTASPLVDGHPGRSTEALALVRRGAGEDAWLAEHGDSSGSMSCRCSWQPTAPWLPSGGISAACACAPNILIGGVHHPVKASGRGDSKRSLKKRQALYLPTIIALLERSIGTVPFIRSTVRVIRLTIQLPQGQAGTGQHPPLNTCTAPSHPLSPR